MFRPLLSSVPTSNYYAGKSSPAWNSSVTTSSNASSDLGTSGAHDIEEHEHIDDDATSGITKVLDSNVNDEEIFMFEKAESVNDDTRTMKCDTATSVVLEDFNGQDDMLVCSRCGCEYPVTTQAKDDVKLCLNCQKSISALTANDTVTSIVSVASSEADMSMSDKDHEFVSNTVKPQLTLVKDESPELTYKGESQSEQHEELVLNQLNHDEISQSSLSYSDTRGEQIQQTVDFPKSKDESLEAKGISTILERSSSIKGPVTRSRNFSASSISYDALSYMSASSSVDFGPRLQSQLSSRRSDIENYNYDPANAKHRRSMSSLSATSSHAFHPSSVGTSTLDSFDVSVVCVERDAADSASVGLQENPNENVMCTEDVGSVEILLPELVNDDQVSDVRVERDVADSASVGPQQTPSENDTCTENVDSKKALLPEPLNGEEPASVLKDEDLKKYINALVACTVEEGTSLTAAADNNDVTEAQQGALSEEVEVDQTCSSSPASQCHVSQHPESSIEGFHDPNVSDAVSKDMGVSDMDINTGNHSSSINESTVLVEGEKGTKGRSLTLEEATDTILFCSSIVHNLAYEAANIAIEKETPSEPSVNNEYQPLVPAVTKSYPDRKDLQSRKTSKRSSKSQKTKRKTTETDTIKSPNNVNTDEETDLQKTRIVYSK
ncbi:uncharacterized protein LOC143555358 isoform X2 [Bidens hawaiensis]|uniref:uncharacterized protein LOC143555358 isoform X2 n=1 Tax=Bidens hawaiensis TaxID=980011 RepID=UPI00404B0C65